VLGFGLKLEHPLHTYKVDHAYQIRLVPDFLECNYCNSQGASAQDYIILEILKAKNIKIMVFKDMTPCSLVERYQDTHSSTILHNADWSSPTSYGRLRRGL
jgi:hypothetical protein